MSEEVKKITEEELKKVVTFQNDLAKAIQNVGILEAEKHGVLHQIGGLNQDQGKLKQELEEKYGSISINLQDGSYEEIKPETKEEDAVEEEK
jgi:bisphosphoglycerate-dependent phosphoglycerate mutase